MKLTKEDIIAKLEAAKAAGMIRNVDYKDYSERANRLLSAAYDYGAGCGGRIDMTGAGDAEYKIEFGFPSSVLHCPGYVKRASMYPRFKERIALAAEWVAVAELLQAVKPMIVKGRLIKEKTAEELAIEAAEEARKRTCQICGLKFQVTDKARNLVLHGFQRPGVGYVIGDCFGHGYPAFEASRDRLGEWIKMEKEKVGNLNVSLMVLKADPSPAEIETVSRRGQKIVYKVGDDAYARALEIAIFQTEADIRHTEFMIKKQQRRFDKWTKTE